MVELGVGSKTGSRIKDLFNSFILLSTREKVWKTVFDRVKRTTRA